MAAYIWCRRLPRLISLCSSKIITTEAVFADSNKLVQSYHPTLRQCLASKHTDNFPVDAQQITNAEGTNARAEQNHISLTLPDDVTRLVPWHVAVQIAEKYNAELVDTTDPETGRVIYRLISKRDASSDKVRKGKSTTEQPRKKTIKIVTKIAENDLRLRIKKIIELLKNEHPVMVHITVPLSANETTAFKYTKDKIHSMIEQETKDYGTININKNIQMAKVILITPKKKSTPSSTL